MLFGADYEVTKGYIGDYSKYSLFCPYIHVYTECMTLLCTLYICWLDLHVILCGRHYTSKKNEIDG